MTSAAAKRSKRAFTDAPAVAVSPLAVTNAATPMTTDSAVAAARPERPRSDSVASATTSRAAAARPRARRSGERMLGRPRRWRMAIIALLSSSTTRPSASATVRSAAAATCASCVTVTSATPLGFSESRISKTLSAETESRLPVGSSDSKSVGRVAIARAIATRCFSPPESVAGAAYARLLSPTASSASSALARRSRRGTPACSSPISTFSVAVR